MKEKKKLKPVHILFADDDEDDRALFKQMIDELNVNVELSTVKDGYHLMYALSEIEWLPDVIFLDLNMPRKSGVQCLTEIRNDKKLRHIPIVIFSTSSNRKDIDETYDKGANLYVCKPANFTTQKTIFKKILLINWKEFMPFASRTNYFFTEDSPPLLHS